MNRQSHLGSRDRSTGKVGHSVLSCDLRRNAGSAAARWILQQTGPTKIKGGLQNRWIRNSRSSSGTHKKTVSRSKIIKPQRHPAIAKGPTPNAGTVRKASTSSGLSVPQRGRALATKLKIRGNSRTPSQSAHGGRSMIPAQSQTWFGAELHLGRTARPPLCSTPAKDRASGERKIAPAGKRKRRKFPATV